MSTKEISQMLEIKTGDISDKNFLESLNIDCIVNAAKPTLMGSDNPKSVDCAIHKAINEFFKEAYDSRRNAGLAETGEQVKIFKKEICRELKTDEEELRIRCKRGEAVLTSGYGLCKYIIHVVGPKYDGVDQEECTSSCVAILEECYKNIIKVLKEKPDIKKIAVPIVSAGEYGFPYELAVKIAIASIGNALIQWKKTDAEMFNDLAAIEKIYFIVFENANEGKCNDILGRYRPYFEKNKLVVYQTAKEATKRYIREIEEHDEERGYFSVAKNVRIGLLKLRRWIDVSNIIKDLRGKDDWEQRRCIVEKFSVLKIVFAVIMFVTYIFTGDCVVNSYCYKAEIVCFVASWMMVDTLSYLLLLIVLADIQKPSANIIRSMILLAVNYVEVAVDFSIIYYRKYCLQGTTVLDALRFGFWGDTEVKIGKIGDFLLVGSRNVFEFFFITLVIGYFMGSLKQREFRMGS